MKMHYDTINERKSLSEQKDMFNLEILEGSYLLNITDIKY